MYYDIVGNMHMHTVASDGKGTHEEVAEAAIKAGLDFIIYTDHNVAVDGQEGWYKDPKSGKALLRLMGQEVNDQSLEPELNHLLCHFVSGSLDEVAANPQTLIDTVTEHGGLTFLAHPIERPGYGAAAETYPWISWDVTGYTGIELWNAMSDAKWRLRSLPRGILGGYFPHWVFLGPFPEVLAKWDELLATGQKVVAIGNSDAHAWPLSWKILSATYFPYEFLFRAVNTHLLLESPPSKNVDQARQQIFAALKRGNCYVSYDLIGSPRGFSFEASSGAQKAIMGDSIQLQGSTVTFSVNSPARAYLRLLKDGRPVAEAKAKTVTWQTAEPGVYRVEATRNYLVERRGWVFTNPIYVGL